MLPVRENSKPQIPNAKQYQIPKIEFPKRLTSVFEFCV